MTEKNEEIPTKKLTWEKVCVACDAEKFYGETCLQCGSDEVTEHWCFNEILTQKYKAEFVDCGDCGDTKDVIVRELSSKEGGKMFQVGCDYCSYDGEDAFDVKSAITNWCIEALGEADFWLNLHAIARTQ